MNKKLCKNSTCQETSDAVAVDKKYTSMNSLIAWNIAKLLQSKPNIDLKSEIATIQERLESKSCDINSAMSCYPEDRYLTCALLAWQQLGHGDTNSLYRFIQKNVNMDSAREFDTLVTEDIHIVSTSDVALRPETVTRDKELIIPNDVDSINSDANSQPGPVVNLPVETKIVMRCENVCKSQSSGNKPQKTQNTDVKKKIEEACSIESACKDRLAEMKTTTSELKQRVGQLAKREEVRVKLLMRAESAWKDLENGYLRRLKLADEKEEDLSKQIKNLIDERSDYKNVCTALSKTLEERVKVVEKEGDDLKKIEEEVWELARRKFRVNEEMACAESNLAQQQCRAAQIERDHRFREEQDRRKVINLENSAESSRGLRYEAERALRNELGALKDQVEKVSKRLLFEESETSNIKTELDDLRVNKANILEDLDACKIMCDHHMQGKVTELRKKTEKLADIKEKMLECRCKVPQDSCVEVKRTPSLAAICRCSSEDHIQDACSCTSLRSSLLSNLLKDLFGGLQSELSDNGSIMPCSLLKCLEDKHNWDRSSVVKSNLRSYFGKLLIGELDIAIASCIGKYHAKWVGASCADETSRIPNEIDVEEWQERALENRAQKLAKQLAEQLFQDKADQLMEKAKDMIKLTPPPCECDKCDKASTTATTYPCIYKTQMNKLNIHNNILVKASTAVRENTLKNLTQPHAQMAEQKPRIGKKNFTKSTKNINNNSVRQSYGPGNNSSTRETKKVRKELNINSTFHHRAISTDRNLILTNVQLNSPKKRRNENSILSGNTKTTSFHQNMSKRLLKRSEESYAVNLCLYEPQKDENIEIPFTRNKLDIPYDIDKNIICGLEETNKVNVPSLLRDTTSFEFENSLNESLEKPKKNLNLLHDLPCSKGCLCLNNVPSDTSFNKILDAYRHKESMLTNLIDNNNIHEFANRDRNLFGLNPDKLTNTNVESKSNKCESKCIDTISFDKNNALIAKLPNILQKNSEYLAADHTTENNNQNSKEVEVNLCDKNYYKNSWFTTNGTMTKISSKRDMNLENNGYLIDSPTHDQCCKYTSTERNICNIQTSVQSFLAQCNQRNINLIYKYIGDTTNIPLDSNCHVEFLGVTLNNNINSDSTNQLLKKVFSNHVVSPTNCKCTQIQSKHKSQNNEYEYISSNGNSNNKNGENIVTNNYEHLSDKKSLTLEKGNNCVCCNKSDDNTDLEVNTFELLTEYLQKKLEEFKLSTSKSSSILPYEEELLYTDILKKVKNIIMEMNTEITCKCFEDSQTDGVDVCWKRACGLLQEYLRTKIKRIKCSCFVKNNNSNTKLPEVLEKVCQLIENDFKQLKEMYINKNVSLKTVNLNSKENANEKYVNRSLNEVLRQDLNNVISNMIMSVCDASNNSNILNVNNESGQFIKGNKLLEEASNANIINSTRNEVHFKQNNEQNDLPKTETISKHNCFYIDNSIFDREHPVQTQSTTFSSNIVFDEENNFPEEHKNDGNIKTQYKKESLPTPFSSSTLDFPYDKMLGLCICAKSTLAHNKINTENILKVGGKKNVSCIIQNVVEPKSSKSGNVRHEDEKEFENEIDTHASIDEIKLLESKHNLEKGVHNSTNTSIYLYDDIEYLSYDEWDDCESSPYNQNANEESSNKEKLYDSLHLPVNSIRNRAKSSTIEKDLLLSGMRSQDCNCEMVPICHVKMLMDNIERKLENSNCTCDSLIPNVCPVHFAFYN